MIGKTFNRWAMLYTLFCLKSVRKAALSRRCADRT